MYGALALGALLAAVLSVATVGLPATMVLAGAWAYSALVTRWLTALSGPSCWAAGFVIEMVLLAGESFVVATLSPHAHPQFVDVVILLVPLLVAGALFWRFFSMPRLRGPRTGERWSGEPWLALMVVVLVEGMFEVINLHGHYFGLTWVMSGDARNQVAVNRGILAAGGLTLKGLKVYPEMANVFSALLGGAGGRANLTTSALMIRDIQALAATTVLFTVGTALFLIAAVAETVTRLTPSARRLPLSVVVPLGACGSIAISAFVLGLGLRGGFFSAIAVVTFVLATTVLGMRVVREYSNAALLLLTLSLFLVVATWTVLVVVPIACLLVAYASLWWQSRRLSDDSSSPRWPIWTIITVGFSLACLFGVTGEIFVNRIAVLAVLKSYGDIPSPNISYFIWMGIAAVVVVAIAPSARQRLLRIVPVVIFLFTGATVLWIQSIAPVGVSWPYYAVKMLWLSTACLLWLPFVIVTDAIGHVTRWRRLGVIRHVGAVAIAAVGSWSLLWVVNYEADFPIPFEWAYVGSTIPLPQVFNLVVNEVNQGGPFVVYDYFRFNQDQLGNLWSALSWDFTPSGSPVGSWTTSFIYWSATEDGSVKSLCLGLKENPMRVVTRSPTLISQLKATCPAYRRELGLSTGMTSH